jgi:pimeloyl-ACP methyl ester carboxylesterase
MTTDGLLATHTYARGGGTPLVLIPGFPLDRRMWDDVATRLPAGVTVLAVDPPGLGRSPDGEVVGAALGVGPVPSLETSADAVAATLRAAGIRRVVVAGLSMGGYIAMALLERHPELVAGVALVDTRSTPDDDAGRANRLRVADSVLASGRLDELAGMPRTLLSPENQGRPDLVERVAGWIGEQRPLGVAWSQRAMAARPDRTTVLAACQVPAVVVVGEQDRITPVAAAEHMMDVLHDAADLVLVPHAGHLTSVEDPDAVAEALTELVRRVDGSHTA